MQACRSRRLPPPIRASTARAIVPAGLRGRACRAEPGQAVRCLFGPRCDCFRRSERHCRRTRRLERRHHQLRLAHAAMYTGVPGSVGINAHGGTTTLGGLVGHKSRSSSSNAWATGNVGGPYDNLRVGGLVGDNSGCHSELVLRRIYMSRRAGGQQQQAGGLGCRKRQRLRLRLHRELPVTVTTISALVFGSHAYTNVTVGSESLAGGLAGSGNGIFANSSAAVRSPAAPTASSAA